MPVEKVKINEATFDRSEDAPGIGQLLVQKINVEMPDGSTREVEISQKPDTKHPIENDVGSLQDLDIYESKRSQTGWKASRPKQDRQQSSNGAQAQSNGYDPARDKRIQRQWAINAAINLITASPHGAKIDPSDRSTVEVYLRSTLFPLADSFERDVTEKEAGISQGSL